MRSIFTKPTAIHPKLTVAKNANKIWLAMTKGLDFSSPDADEVRLRTAILKSESLPRRH